MSSSVTHSRTMLSVRIPHVLMARIERLADAQDITVTAAVATILEYGIGPHEDAYGITPSTPLDVPVAPERKRPAWVDLYWGDIGVKSNADVAAEAGVSAITVRAWAARKRAGGVA